MNHTLRKILASKYLAISVAAMLFYALVGFVLAPLAIRWYAPKYAQQNLHCQASVDTIRINPFLLTFEINRFSLNQADKSPLVAFDRFFVDLEMSSLFHWAVVLKGVELEKPDIHVVIEPDGSINFEKLAPQSPQLPEPAKKVEAQPLAFICQSVAVKGGRIGLVNKLQSTPVDFTLQGFDLQLMDLSTVKDYSGTYHLAATTEAGESFQWDGEIALAPLRSKGKLNLNTIQIATLWQFFKDSTNLEQPAGKINVSAEYRLVIDNAPAQMTFEGLHVSFADLSLKLLKTDKPLFQLKKLDLDAPRFDLATKQLHVGRLFLEDGIVDARIYESGEMNLQQIIRESRPKQHQGKETPIPAAQPSASVSGGEQKSTPSPPPTADPPLKMQVDAIEVKNIAFDLDDKSRKVPFKAAIAGVDLRLRAALELGANKNSMVFREIASELRGASVHSSQSREPLFTAEKLTAEGGLCNLDTHSLTFARIAMNKGRLDAGRDAEGNINWQQLLQSKGAVEKLPTSKSASDVGPTWGVLVKSFEVEGFSSKFSDLTTHSDKPVLSLQNFKARLADVDGKSPMGFNVGFQVEQGGSTTVSGTLNPSVPSVEAEVNVSGMALTSLQPYLEPYVTLKLQSASIAAQGRLRHGVPGDAQKTVYEGNFSLNNLRLIDSSSSKKPYLSWDAVQLPKFKLTLQPNRLDAQEIRIVKPVGEFIIGEDKTLNLAKVFKDKPIANKTQQTASPAAKSATKKAAQPVVKKTGQKKEEEVFLYQIAKVRVEKGNVVFADLSLRPRFMTRIHDLKGTVTGLSSAKDAQAKIKMDGQVDQYGTAKINGVIRPNNFGSASDVEMIFRNVEMKNLSPYSGKFAGRLIKSGKFSADLKYKLQDHKMAGDNKIVIDNLSLGEQVDSSEATNLPLDLAIALLKDSSGRIDVGLPVTGDLNDPHFSIGSLVWKVFTNLITKATTAPFLALGSLLGGSEEKFDAVAFDPGSADLPPPEKEKLLKLVNALKSRPQLKLVVQGRYSPEVDGMEFKERSIHRSVATRLGTKLGPNDNPEPLDFVDSGTQNTLEKLYKEHFGKESLNELEKGIEAGTVTPRTPARQQEQKGKEAGMFSKMAEGMKLYKVIPGGKSHEQAVLWAGELYVRLVEDEKVADETFLQLAENRAQSIAVFLDSEAQIPKDRVSIKAPEPLSDNELPSVTLSLDAL